MGAAPVDRSTQLFDRVDHVAVIDFQPLVGLFTRCVKGWAFAGVEPHDGRQRPMGARNLGGGGDDQGGIAQRNKHLATLRVGPLTP